MPSDTISHSEHAIVLQPMLRCWVALFGAICMTMRRSVLPLAALLLLVPNENVTIFNPPQSKISEKGA